MTAQEIKARLNAVRTAYREYELAQEKALRFRSVLTGAVQSVSDIPQSDHSENSREKGLLKMIECSEETDRKLNLYLDARNRAEQMIDSLDDRKEREILTRRYILGEKWEEIAEKMHYSRQHVTRLHGYALSKMCLNVTFLV